MRVAVTLEQLWHRVPGGTARAAIDMVQALLDHTDIDLVGVSARHSGPPPDDWASPIAVGALPLPRIALYDSWQRLRWPRVERATGPVDLVHATGYVAPAARAPWVASVYDLHFLYEPEHFTKRGASVFNRFLELVRKEARLVLVPSEATRVDCVAAGIGEDRLRVTPLATDATPVTPAEVQRVRDRYDLDQPFVLFVGTAEPRKNLRRLLDAHRRLGEGRPELVLVGPEGWDADLDTSGTRRLGFVPRADLHALYAAATVFAYPSIREGFGLPVLEAMVQGAAVLTAAGTSTAEVAGDAGVLVDPLDVDAIAGGLERLLASPDDNADLRAKAVEQSARFTWARMAESTAAAYHEAVEGRR